MGKAPEVWKNLIRNTVTIIQQKIVDNEVDEIAQYNYRNWRLTIGTVVVHFEQLLPFFPSSFSFKVASLNIYDTRIQKKLRITPETILWTLDGKTWIKNTGGKTTSRRLEQLIPEAQAYTDDFFKKD